MRRDVPGQLGLERRLFTFARGLLAAVLLFLAWFPLDYVVRAWRYFSAEASLEEWRQASLGFALAGLAVVVPAATAWLYLRRRRFAFADVARVTVSRRQPHKSTVTFPVTLMMRNGSEVVVSDAPGKAQARQTAELVADTVGVAAETVDP